MALDNVKINFYDNNQKNFNENLLMNFSNGEIIFLNLITAHNICLKNFMSFQAISNLTMSSFDFQGSNFSQTFIMRQIQYFSFSNSNFTNNILTDFLINAYNNSEIYIGNLSFLENSDKLSMINSNVLAMMNFTITNDNINLENIDAKSNQFDYLSLFMFYGVTKNLSFSGFLAENNVFSLNLILLIDINFINFDSFSLKFNKNNGNFMKSSLISAQNFKDIRVSLSEFLYNIAFSNTVCLELLNYNVTNKENDTITIVNSTFAHNLANYTQDHDGGSAIFLIFKGKASFSSCFFENNTIISPFYPKYHIGGPCIYSPNIVFSQEMLIDSCFFEANWAIAESSCIHFEGFQFSIRESLFKNNDLASDFIVNEGIFYGTSFCSNVYLHLLLSNFENTIFIGSEGIYGGSINILLDYKYINQFSSNYTPIISYLNFSQLFLSSSKATDSAGGVQIIQRRNQLKTIISFSNCLFLNNSAGRHGAVLYFEGYFRDSSSKISFSFCNFDTNKASFGGVLENRFENGYLEFLGCYFIENLAFSLTKGGGVFFQWSYFFSLTKNCYFINNFASNEASIMYIQNGKYQDLSSIFYNNTSGSEAGMFILIDNPTIIMNESTINCSKAALKGGFLINLMNSRVFLNKCNFFNISSENSGFIFAGEEAYTEIIASFLIQFQSYGAIFMVKGVRNTLKLENCTGMSWSSLNKSHFILQNNVLFLKNFIILQSNGSFLTSKFCEIIGEDLKISEFTCSNLEFCLFSLKNVNVSLKFFELSNLTLLSGKQSMMLAIMSNLTISSMELSNIKKRYSNNWKIISINALFFIKESQYSIYSSIISQINITAFQIILSSGIFSDVQAVNNNNRIDSFYYYGQFISCFLCISLEINNCLISGMSAERGAVVQINDIYESFFYQTLIGYDFLSIISNNSQSIYIHDSNFSYNQASDDGGVFYFLDFSLLIENCEFKNNEAKQGGAILFNCTSFVNDNQCIWTIRKSFFENNKAEKRGGALHWLNRKPLIENDNIFQNNEAQKGPDFSSNPIKLSLLETNESTVFTSGSYTNATLRFELLDAYDQIYEDENSLAYLIFDKTQSKSKLTQKFVSNQFVSIDNGTFFFDDFNIISTPGYDSHLLAYTNSVAHVSQYLNLSTPSNNRNLSNHYYYAVAIHIRDCKQGEIYQNTTNVCFPCPDGSFSFYPSDTQCTECPQNAICLKGEPFKNKKGYWRMHENSSTLYRCTIKKAGCVGGIFEDQCLFGYTGPLCSACLFNDTFKYFNSFGGCSPCGASNTFLILITVIVLLTGMVGLIFFSIKDSQNYAINQDLKEVLVTVLINILINYTQLFSIVSNIDIKWPEFFSSSSSSSSTPTSITDFIGVIECPIATFAYSNKFSIFYVQMVMMAFLFFGMLIGNLLFWLFFRFIRKKIWKKDTELKNNIILTYIAIYTLMLQPLLNFYTKGFSCIEVGDNFSKKHFLKVAPSIECWEETHISLIKNVIVPFLLIFILPPPLIMIYYIKKNYKKQEDPQVRQKLFMVTIGYKEKYCYWEFVVLLKKIILMYLSIFIRDEPVICVLTLLFVLLIFCNLHVVCNPYEYEFLNKLIVEQYIALFICYSVFLYFSYTESVSASLFLILIMFLANVVFFLHWIVLFYHYIKVSLRNLKNALKKTTDLINNFKQISSALRRKRTGVIRSQTSLSQTKLSPRGSKFIQKNSNQEIKEETKKALKTTPGKSQLGSNESYEIVENPFKSERKYSKKDDIGITKIPDMLIIQEEKN